MEKLISELKLRLLEPKKEKLISELIKLLLGKQDDFIPYPLKSFAPFPMCYIAYYDLSFSFDYTFIGDKNYTINIAAENDRGIIENIYDEFEIWEDDEQLRINEMIEYEFFSKSWKIVENRISKEIKGFLLIHGLDRGVDLNTLERIEFDNLRQILSSYHGIKDAL